MVRLEGLLAAVILLLGTASAAHAAGDERLFGLVVEDVRIDAAPLEDSAALSRLSGLVVGTPFTAEATRRAVKILYQLGRFRNVYVHAERVGNGVVVHLSLPPRPFLNELSVAESEVLTPTELERTIGLTPGGELDPATLRDKREAIERRLERLGYRDAAIGLALRPVDQNGGLDLLVRVEEGPATLVRNVVVRGQPRMALWRLGRRLGVESGDVLDLTKVESALANLEREYESLGYFEAKIQPPLVRELPDRRDGAPLADLVVDIDSGPKVRVRFKGNVVVPTRELQSDASILRELGTGPSVFGEVRERILARYERRGYFRAQVSPAVRITGDKKKKEVLFSISEGRPARVASLSFPGNRTLSPAVLRAQVYEVVGQSLLDELERPGASPQVVGGMLGDHSMADRPRDTPQPINTAPDPRRVYISRAYRAAADAIADLYRADGFQTVDVSPPRVTERGGGELIDVAIDVQQGVQWLVGAISFSGNESIEAASLFELADINPVTKGGRPLAFDRVEEARRAILTRYKNEGFLYADVNEQLRQVPPRGSLGSYGYVSTSSVAPLDVRSVCARAESEDKPSCEVELVFRIVEGPRVKTRDVIVRGVQDTRPGIVRGELMVAQDSTLREKDMVETRDNLLRIGVFERVSVRPIDEERPGAEKDVVIELHERKNLSLELGGGASTEEGLRVFAGFGDANLGGTALRLQLQGKLNVWLPALLLLYDARIRDEIKSFYDQFSTLERLEYEVASGLSYPRIFGLPRGFSAGLDVIALRDFEPAFAENTQTVTLIGTYKGFRPTLAGGPRPIALQLRTSVERSDLLCNGAILESETRMPTVDPDRRALCSSTASDPTALRIEGNNAYASIGPQVSWDLRDDALDPTAGLYLELESGVSKGLDAQSPDLAMVEARANFYLPLPSRFVLALSAQIGKIFPLQSTVARASGVRSCVDGTEPGTGGGLDIPVNRRLFAGGRSTVRGYPEKTLLPQDVAIDCAGAPLSSISSGGLLMVAFKSELRFAILGALSMALFWDVGDLFESGHFSFETRTLLSDGREVNRFLAMGAGVGIRFATPIGPLSVDLAFPVNSRDPGADNPQLHFSVGTF